MCAERNAKKCLRAKNTKLWSLFGVKIVVWKDIYFFRFVFRPFPLVSAFVPGFSALVWLSKMHSTHETPKKVGVWENDVS